MNSADMLIEEGRVKGLEEGRQEGRREAARELLVKLLVRKFGVLPPELMARVNAADATRIEQWAERLLTASNPEAVLSDE